MPLQEHHCFPFKYNDMSNNFMIFETLHIHFSKRLRERERWIESTPILPRQHLATGYPFPGGFTRHAVYSIVLQ